MTLMEITERSGVQEKKKSPHAFFFFVVVLSVLNGVMLHSAILRLRRVQIWRYVCLIESHYHNALHSVHYSHPNGARVNRVHSQASELIANQGVKKKKKTLKEIFGLNHSRASQALKSGLISHVCLVIVWVPVKEVKFWLCDCCVETIKSSEPRTAVNQVVPKMSRRRRWCSGASGDCWEGEVDGREGKGGVQSS